MVDSNAPRIFTFKIVEEGKSTFVVAEFGAETVRKEIPPETQLVRVAAILDDKRRLSGLELVTSEP